MDQSGNNHLLLRATQSAPPAYNGQHTAAERMRELLARTVHDHIVEERSVASALQEIRLRLDAMGAQDGTGVTGIVATLDGLAATFGTLDSKLTARLERLDERLDDQYDRVRSIDGKLDAQATGMEEAVAKAVDAASADIVARIASLEDTIFTLAEALLRPAIRAQNPANAARNGRNLGAPPKGYASATPIRSCRGACS
ncbi:MAG: hypothetical protein ACRDNW_08425 [Trebonia sp.]